MGGNPNIPNIEQGCEELEQCIRDFVEIAKEDYIAEVIRRQFGEDVFGDLDDVIAREREEKQELIEDLKQELERVREMVRVENMVETEKDEEIK